jgi:hypothetical protein
MIFIFALLIGACKASPIQTFLTEFWTLYGAKDAYIRPLDSKDLTNHCPRGGLYRAETHDCIRWFSPGCGDGGIVNITTMQCRRRSSPMWLPHINTSDPTLETQICMAAGMGPSSHLILNATAAAQRTTFALKCVGPRDDMSAKAIDISNPQTLTASLGGSLGALLGLVLIGIILYTLRRKKSPPRKQPTIHSRQSPLHVTRTQPYESTLTFYKLQPRSASAASSVAITIPEQRNTFRPMPSRRATEPLKA